jgi:hypothetical protein
MDVGLLMYGGLRAVGLAVSEIGGVPMRRTFSWFGRGRRSAVRGREYMTLDEALEAVGLRE